MYKRSFYHGFLYLRQEHHLLLEKLSALEKRVIVGGVDLLAKAEEQEKLLEESNNELEERRRRAEQLRRELEEKEVEIKHAKWESWLFVIAHDSCKLVLNSKSGWTSRRSTPVYKRKLKGRPKSSRKCGPCWWLQNLRCHDVYMTLGHKRVGFRVTS